MSKIAFVFPGQGSQYVGMAKDLCQNFDKARKIFEEASDCTGLDIKKISFDGPESDLNLTANTQPAILTASVAALEVLKAEKGVQADYAAGHSLGEYTALVYSGVIAFADAVKVVRKRGLLMQDAVPAGSGAMAAILGLNDDEVSKVCDDASDSGVVAPANFNSPGQIVISGILAAVEKAVGLAKERGAKRAIMLPVSVPSHCSLMDNAADVLKTELSRVVSGNMAIPVVSNVDACPYPSNDDIEDILARQLRSPVRWVDSIAYMKDQDVDRIIEIGPGKVLCGLVKRIDKDINLDNIEDVSSLNKMAAIKG